MIFMLMIDIICDSHSVIPWLDHEIQKIIKNTNFISIFNWIPLQARGMRTGKLIYAIKPQWNDSCSSESHYK